MTSMTTMNRCVFFVGLAIFAAACSSEAPEQLAFAETTVPMTTAVESSPTTEVPATTEAPTTVETTALPSTTIAVAPVTLIEVDPSVEVTVTEQNISDILAAFNEFASSYDDTTILLSAAGPAEYGDISVSQTLWAFAAGSGGATVSSEINVTMSGSYIYSGSLPEITGDHGFMCLQWNECPAGTTSEDFDWQDTVEFVIGTPYFRD